MRDRKITIPIIAILIIAIISLGIAFATFATTLNINGNATVDATNWEIVFEGLQNVNTLGSPTITGTATEVTHPTIKKNATEISDYEVTMQAPGDSITYNFKIHNKGSYAAKVTGVDIKQGIYLTTNTSKRTSAAATLNNIQYTFYYTDNNALVGSGNEKDCLAPGEEENVTLKIIFNTSDNTGVLPSEDLVLDNLGVKVVYTQENSCSGFTGGPSGTLEPEKEITSETNGGGISKKPPKPTSTGTTGGKVSLPTSGSSVTYNIEYEEEVCMEIESITLPDLEAWTELNPGVSSSDLANISVTVTDSSGNSAVGMQIPANTETILKVIIANNGSTLTDTLNIPDIDITYADECTVVQPSSTEYLVTINNTNTWVDSLSDLAQYTWNHQNPNVYVKRKNDETKICFVRNSSEHCYGRNTTRQDIGQFCSAYINTPEDAFGSWEGEENGIQCFLYNDNGYIKADFTEDSYFIINSDYADLAMDFGEYFYSDEIDDYHENECGVSLARDGSFSGATCSYY
jgi:hypothetical protein